MLEVLLFSKQVDRNSHDFFFLNVISFFVHRKEEEIQLCNVIHEEDLYDPTMTRQAITVLHASRFQ